VNRAAFASRYPWLAPHADRSGIAWLVDHTLLKPEATKSDIGRTCGQARQAGFGAVCVNAEWVGTAARALEGSGVRVAATVGFPLGASGLAAKSAEARLAVLDGATELDMVVALGLVRGADWRGVEDEIAAVVAAAAGRLVKVILETAVLSAAEVERAARTAVEAGAGMVKTSTGFHPAGGATIERVRLLRATVGNGVGVKASGGIRTAEAALAMLAAGADRIGASAALEWKHVIGPGAPALARLLT
jgi:deoxyribose-phosphate aldolase